MASNIILLFCFVLGIYILFSSFNGSTPNSKEQNKISNIEKMGNATSSFKPSIDAYTGDSEIAELDEERKRRLGIEEKNEA